MATKAALSGDRGTSAFLSLLWASLSCRSLKLKATILMRFSTIRQVGLFSRVAHSTAECSWSAYDINAGIVRHPLLAAILVPLRSYFFFWTYSRSVYSNSHLRTDAVHSRSLAHLFSSTRFTTALGRVITHFSVAKLVCRRARLKSLGQWRSFTNLPLSSLWF